jgi:hypothetical protein
MGLPKFGEIFEGQPDFKIRAEPLQPPYKHKPDPDIPPKELPFGKMKRFHTCDPDRGKQQDIKVAQTKARAVEDEKKGKKTEGQDKKM